MWGATVAALSAGPVVVKDAGAQPVAGRCRARAANINHPTLSSNGYTMSLLLCIGRATSSSWSKSSSWATP